MNRTLFAVVITIIVMSILFLFSLGAIRVGHQRDEVWLISAVKAPGRMALDDIQAEMNAGNYDAAKLMIGAFKKQWTTFEQEQGFHGQAIGIIMVEFGRLDQTNAPESRPAIPSLLR